MLIKQTTQNINPSDCTYDVGLFPTMGGRLIVGVNPTDGYARRSPTGTPLVFKYLIARGGAGDIVVQGLDLEFYLIPEAAIGKYNPALGWRVVPSATLNDGIVYNTTATDIWWMGGK